TDAPPRRHAGRRHHESRAQSAEDLPGAESSRPLRRGGLRRTRHDEERRHGAALRARGGGSPLLLADSRAGLGEPIMSGRLYVIGTGPGNPQQMTPEALAAVADASEFFGYGPYVGRLSLRPDQTVHASDNREELDRAKAALERAASGATVCVVSGGDPGVFAMAAAGCQAIDHCDAAMRHLDGGGGPG